MRITFDRPKRDKTLAARGLAFEDAEAVFEGLTLTVEDLRHAYGERRFQTVGFLSGRMVMLVWTQRADARHVISMRKCNAKEQARYQKQFAEG